MSERPRQEIDLWFPIFRPASQICLAYSYMQLDMLFLFWMGKHVNSSENILCILAVVGLFAYDMEKRSYTV